MASGQVLTLTLQGSDPDGDPLTYSAQAINQAYYLKQSLGLYATGRLADDAMIDPRDTRDAVGFALSAVHNNVVEGAKGFGVFRL